MALDRQIVDQRTDSQRGPLVRIMFDDLPDLDLPQVLLNNQGFEPGDVGYNLLEVMAKNGARLTSGEQLWDVAYPVGSTLRQRELVRDLQQLNLDLQRASRQRVNFIQADAHSERFRLAHCRVTWASDEYLPGIKPATRVEVTQTEGGVYQLNGRELFVRPAALRLLAALPQPPGVELPVGMISQEVLGRDGSRPDFTGVRDDLNSVLWSATGKHDLVGTKPGGRSRNGEQQLSSKVRTVWPQPDLHRAVILNYLG